jgi:hypothetical protein
MLSSGWRIEANWFAEIAGLISFRVYLTVNVAVF